MDDVDIEFSFAEWHTPFQDADVSIEEVHYENGGKLTICLSDNHTLRKYKVCFTHTSAFRILDEHGLMEVWSKTSELGGRPNSCTFKVHNNQWSQESPVTFLASGGWSYIIASSFECAEVVSKEAPLIILAN